MLSSVLKATSANKLLCLLNSIEGEKDLVIDKELIGSLDKVANFPQLKGCGVAKVFRLSPGAAPGGTLKCVYLIKPTIENTQIVCDHINASKSVNSPKQFWLINVPRKLHASQMMLEAEGVYGDVIQMVFDLGFISLDKDLFSLEISDFFERFYLNGDSIDVYTAATALLELLRICGSTPKIFGHGTCAKKVIELTHIISEDTDGLDESAQKFLNKLMEDSANNPHGLTTISHLVVLDRDIDFVPLLMSQLTYEGMVDECFGISNGKVVFPKEVTGKEEIKVPLNSNDVVYASIRNDHFACVFDFLRGKAKELQSKSETSRMSLGEIKNLVAKELKGIQQQHASLSLHIGACEVIMNMKKDDDFRNRLRVERDILEGVNLKDGFEYISELIDRQPPAMYLSPLGLMCLLSLSQDGILTEEYTELATDYRQTYGATYFPVISKLEKLGLYTERKVVEETTAQTKTSKITEAAATKASEIAEKLASVVAFPKNSSFTNINKKFKLIPPESDEALDLKNPKDMSYVFGNSYVPLIGRITEEVIMYGDIKAIEENMKLLPGTTIKDLKKEDIGSGFVTPSNRSNSKTVLVYVLGGITFAEIAALRFLGKLHGCRIIIATTHLTSFRSFIQVLSVKEVTD